MIRTKLLAIMLLRAKRGNLSRRAAMFGLFRALRKQFGELFLERRQSEAPQGASVSFKTSRAAMFGLDARIALAIFGALSVISGAALYSAIQQAKVVQWQTYFNELSKASEAYYLDTGSPLPLSSNASFASYLEVGINRLMANVDSSSGWKGPYWNATFYSNSGSNDHYIKDNRTSTIDSSNSLFVFLKTSDPWSNAIDTNSNVEGVCVSNTGTCYEWWSFYPDASAGTANLLSLYNLLDDSIDGRDGPYNGDIRYSTAGNDSLFVKGRLRQY